MNIAVLGPRGSGKTCFLYLMLHKLRAANIDKYCFANFKDFGTINLVTEAIEKEAWPQPTASVESGDGYIREHVLRFCFDLKNFLKPKYKLVIPERSGILFEAYTKLDLCDRTNKIVNYKSLNREDQKAIGECSRLIDKCSGIILVLDMASLADKSSNAHKSKYLSFLNNIRQRHERVVTRSPLLVLLNKSDIRKHSYEDRYSLDNAREYLGIHYPTLLGGIETIANGNTVWAWHSTTGRVKKKRGRPVLPDYAAYYRIDADLYARSFLQFIDMVNGS